MLRSKCRLLRQAFLPSIRVNLTQYNGSFVRPFRETLLFGKLSDQISDKSSAELSVSNRHETDIAISAINERSAMRATTTTTIRLRS